MLIFETLCRSVKKSCKSLSETLCVNIVYHLFMWQYECLVEGCGLKFKCYKSRHQHLLDKHKFPKSFQFYKKARASQKQRLKQQRKQSTCTGDEGSRSMEVDNETIDGLVSAVSKLSTSCTSPSSVSFGRRRGPSLAFVPRAVQRERRPVSGKME